MATPWQEIINETKDGAVSNRALIEEFLADSDIGPKTVEKYRAHLSEFAEWLDKPLLKTDRRQVKRFLAYLKTDEREARDRARPVTAQKGWRGGLSPSTRKGYLGAIRELFRYCADMYDLDHDPTFAIAAPKIQHSPGLTIRADEVRKFLDAPGRERDRVQAYLLVFTAARSGEIRGLRWDDIDFRNDEINFLTKFAKHNAVPIHPELKVALMRWKKAQGRAAETNPMIAAALSDPDRAFVLLTTNGKPLAHSTVAKQVKWRAARVGLRLHTGSTTVGLENKSKLHPHVLRRSWATLMLNSGKATLDEIAEMLNHSSTETTKTHYAFAASSRKRRTASAFNV